MRTTATGLLAFGIIFFILEAILFASLNVGEPIVVNWAAANEGVGIPIVDQLIYAGSLAGILAGVVYNVLERIVTFSALHPAIALINTIVGTLLLIGGVIILRGGGS